MTFEDLDRELPNGFHDAKIEDVTVNYAERSATLTMHFWVGSMDGPNREEYRSGTLRIHGLCYYAIDPPAPTYPFMRSGSPINVSGYPEDPEKFAALGGLLAVMPKDVTCFRFFVHEWNSFIHIAATDVRLSWAGSETRKGLGASAP
jgi:hypothetical protein